MAESYERSFTPLLPQTEPDLIVEATRLRSLLLEAPALSDALQEFLYGLCEYLFGVVDNAPECDIEARDC